MRCFFLISKYWKVFIEFEQYRILGAWRKKCWNPAAASEDTDIFHVTSGTSFACWCRQHWSNFSVTVILRLVPSSVGLTKLSTAYVTMRGSLKHLRATRSLVDLFGTCNSPSWVPRHCTYRMFIIYYMLLFTQTLISGPLDLSIVQSQISSEFLLVL